MYGTEHTKGYMVRQMRLSNESQDALESGDYNRFISKRFGCLGYSYDDGGDDSGGGSALASITAAAASLGSAYVLSQNRPQTVAVPQTTIPAYGASTAMAGSSSTLLIVGVLFVGLIVFLFAMD